MTTIRQLTISTLSPRSGALPLASTERAACRAKGGARFGRLPALLLAALGLLSGAARAATFVDTTPTDFQAGIATNVDLTTSPGDAILITAPLDQQNTAGTTTGTSFTTTSWGGQTFIPTVTGQLTKVDVQLFASSVTGTTPNLTLSIRNTSGGLPTGADLATATIAGFTNPNVNTYTAVFGAPVTLTAGTQYALILRPVSNPSAGGYFWIRASPSSYANGSRATTGNSGATWALDTTRDFNFKTYIQTVAAPQGDFISSLKDSQPGSHTTLWQSLSWTATTPAATSLKFQAAGSASPAGPFNFVGPDGTAATYFTTSGASLSQFNGSRYLKYRAYFQTTDVSVVPILSDVTAVAAYKFGFVDTTQTDFEAGSRTSVDTTTLPGEVHLPLMNVANQSNTTPGGFGDAFTSTTWGGQTFTPSATGQLVKADLIFFTQSMSGTPPDLTVSVQATLNGLPTGPDLATATIAGFISNSGLATKTVTFAAPVSVQAGTQYALIVRSVSNPTAGSYNLLESGSGVTGADVYPGGTQLDSPDSGATWSPHTLDGVSTDAGFAVYVESDTGNVISSTKDSNSAGGTTLWSTLSWTAATPASTSLQFQVAGSSSASGPFNFVGPDGTAATYFTTSGASLSQFNGNRYLQYRAFLATTDPTVGPVLSDVTIDYAVSFVVNSAADPGDGTFDATEGTLREALAGANMAGGGIITFSPAAQVITLAGTALPTITGSVTINGPAAGLTVDAAGNSIGFQIAAGAVVSMDRLTIANGANGIRNSGNLTLTNCTISGGTAGFGGGISNGGAGAGGSAKLTLLNCTLSGNAASGGGAIGNDGSNGGSATVVATNCTFSGNTAAAGGGDSIANLGRNGGSAGLTLYNCTFHGGAAGLILNDGTNGSATVTAGNTIFDQAGGSYPSLSNVAGTITSLGFNLASDDQSALLSQGTDLNSTNPKLRLLADHGGPTQTFALRHDSPALDAGQALGGVSTDQRGQMRTVDLPDGVYPNAGDGTDIGAFEAQTTPLDPQIAISGQGQGIASGDATPATADGTDFGSTAVAGPGVVRTFTIANTGPATLNLTGTPAVALSGAGAASFAVTAQPATPVAATNGSTTFDITFIPTAPGPQTATVTVANDDTGTYTFAIAGSGANAPIVVNTTDDSSGAGGGVISLRDAIATAGTQTGASTITLPAGTITLTSPLPAITHDTTITGDAGGTTLDGAGQFQVFNVTGGNVSFDGLTIANGLGSAGTAVQNGGTAGGLQIGGAANVTVTNCLFIGNTGGAGYYMNSDVNQSRGAGGGLQTVSSGTVTIRNSTFYRNQGGAGGGQGRGGAGGVQFEGGTIYFESNTVAGNTGGNTAGLGGGGTGGAFTINQSPNVTNSLFADNSAGIGATFNGGVDFGGTMSSGGYNLIQNTDGTDVSVLQPSDLQNMNAGLDAGGPQDHGGPTRTIRLNPDSKALDAGKAPAGSSTDARGQMRPVDLAAYANATGGDGTDIGAYELQNEPIVVTSDTDTHVDGLLTLGEAIAQAEAQPGDDTIVFNIPGAGVHTINLVSTLTGITQPLIIDGYSQPGAAPNTLAVGNNATILIELTCPGGFYGVNLFGKGSTVRGLALGNFNWAFQVSSASGNTITGNYIGLHADGTTPFNNNYGIVVFYSPKNTIGGTRPADRNVISNNNYDGVILQTGADGSVVQGNYIGTNAAGTAALGNGAEGVHVSGTTNITVGGTVPGAGNLISGNAQHGIQFSDGATGNRVQGNRIGTNADGTGVIGNQYGIVTFAATGNTIGGTAPGAGNVITGNGYDGIYIGIDGNNNAIRGNNIYANGLTGILLANGVDLNVTANDDGDADTGANNQQNYPLVTSVSVAGGNLTIGGTLNSTADTAFALDFFVNDAPDASGYGGGQTYLGSGTVTTVGNNGAFNVTLTGVTIPEETYVTATATDPDGNTSIFSPATAFFTGSIQTGPNFVVNTTADSNKLPTTTECSLREAITAASAFASGATITFDPTVFATAQTITLTRGQLEIENAVTITGPDAGVTVDGNNQARVLHVLAGSDSVAISGLTMTNGNASGIYVETGTLTLQNCTVTQNSGAGDAGGIYNAGTLILLNCAITSNRAAGNGGGLHNDGTLTISDSTISQNTAGTFGGGIMNDGTLTIRTSTLAGNTSQQSGGGGLHTNNGSVSLINTTLSNNHADGSGGDNGGGLWASFGPVKIANCTITANTADGTGSAGGVDGSGFLGNGSAITVDNTIIAGNTGTGGAVADVSNLNGSTFTSKGYNLIGDGTGATGFTQGTLSDLVGTTANPIDPRLGPLADNGGLTLTHALLTAPVVSPAIDAGNSGLDTDQRGFARGFDNPAASNGSGNLSDIGAVEQDSTVTPVLQTGPNFVVNTTGDDDDLATTTNCSLREAIKAANGLPAGTATITFDPVVFATAKTITLGGSDLVILHAMTIVGPGADKLTISGNNQSRIFTVNTADGLNTISGLTVTGGNGTGYVFQGLGGAICNVGDLLLVDSAITGSTAAGAGGGFHNHTSATATLRGCTISNNTSTGGLGGGVNSFLERDDDELHRQRQPCRCRRRRQSRRRLECSWQPGAQQLHHHGQHGQRGQERGWRAQRNVSAAPKASP